MKGGEFPVEPLGCCTFTSDVITSEVFLLDVEHPLVVCAPLIHPERFTFNYCYPYEAPGLPTGCAAIYDAEHRLIVDEQERYLCEINFEIPTEYALYDANGDYLVDSSGAYVHDTIP